MSELKLDVPGLPRGARYVAGTKGIVVPRLVFYPSRHRYKLDGKWVPGVTTILSKGLPKPALMYWSAKSVAEWVADHPDGVEELREMSRGMMIAALKEVPWTARDKAAVKGTDVHGLAERLVRGEPVEVPAHLTGYVDAAATFMDEWHIDPDAAVSERPCASAEHQYAGTFDLVADGALWDYKSGSGIYGETALQAAGYAGTEFYIDAASTEQPMSALGIDRSYGVHLRDDGYDVIPLAFGPHVFDAFLRVKATADVADAVKGYAGQPVEPQPYEVVA